MKKHGLFKIILVLLLLITIATWFLPNRSDTMAYLGLGDVLVNTIQSYYYFFDTALFIMVIGGFYGVLNQTGAYKKLLNNIVTKLKSNSKKSVFAIIIIFALLTALTGLTMPLLIFVPFVISIVLLLGYDKLVALTSTIGAMLVGFVGGIFVTFKDPGSYYSVVYTTFEEFCNVEKFSNLFPKLFILAAGIVLLILYVNKHINNVEAKKVKYELNNDTDLLVSEVKGNYKDLKTYPLIIVLGLLLVLLVLGFMPWNSLFGLTVFSDFHLWLKELSISGFHIFDNIISANFTAFGEWINLGNYLMVIVLLLLALIAIKFICKVKINDLIDNFLEGCKKMIPVVAITLFAYTVLVCAYNNGFFEHLVSATSKSMGGLNLALVSLFTIFGSIINVDLYYGAIGVFNPILTAVTDEAMHQVLGVAFQSLHGLVMLVGPTSILLIIGLSYLDIPYTTWLKYIWRFVLELFIIIFAVLLIVSIL